MGLGPSLHTAAQATAAALPASITTLYDRVHGTEPALMRVLVSGSAQRLEAVLAYDVLSVLQAGVYACPASKVAEADDVALYYFADEVRAHYAGTDRGRGAPGLRRLRPARC